jgi:mannose-1-phosphate guanylyltransferase
VEHADNLMLFDLNALIQTHQSRPADCEATMMSFETDCLCTCGILELNKWGVGTVFHEKVYVVRQMLRKRPVNTVVT